MAYAPTEEEAKELLAQTIAQDDKKFASQEKQGKGFVNEGQGVIPESIWKTLPGKTIEDELEIV